MNTEQFDGHTPGHWAITTRKGTWVVHTQDNGDVATMNDYEDAKLIRAAPDLLADNKRLRLIVHELLKDADHDTHIWFHNNGWCKDLRQPCAVCDSRSDAE